MFAKRLKQLSLPLSKHSFWIDLRAITEEETNQAESIVDAFSREKSLRYAREDLRRKHLIAHASLRLLISHELCTVPEKVEIMRTSFGKPYIEGNPIHFNLTHTSQFAICAFHDTVPIGVDMEWIDPKIDACSLGSHFLSQEEMDWMEEVPSQSIVRFYYLWTAKEAYLKAVGTGFACTSLPNFNLRNRAFSRLMTLRCQGNAIAHSLDEENNVMIAISRRRRCSFR